MVVWAASITYLVISTTTSGMVMIKICTEKRNVVVQISLRIAPSTRAERHPYPSGLQKISLVRASVNIFT